MAIENVNPRDIALLTTETNYPITQFTNGIVSCEEARGWPTYDDNFSQYNAYFGSCEMPPSVALSHIKSPLAVLDLMAGTGMIRDLSAKASTNGTLFDKGLSVGLTTRGAGNLPQNLAHISGDLRQMNTWEDVNAAAGVGFNAIFLRAYNGWITIRKEQPDLSSRLFAEILKNSISISQQNAHLFLQAPPWFMHCADELMEYLSSYDGIRTNPVKRDKKSHSSIGRERFGLHIDGIPNLSPDFISDVLEIYYTKIHSINAAWLIHQAHSLDELI